MTPSLFLPCSEPHSCLERGREGERGGGTLLEGDIFQVWKLNKGTAETLYLKEQRSELTF